MKLNGEAAPAMNEVCGYLSRKITVSGPGASIASTLLYWAWRLDRTPAGGKTMWS